MLVAPGVSAINSVTNECEGDACAPAGVHVFYVPKKCPEVSFLISTSGRFLKYITRFGLGHKQATLWLGNKKTK